MSQFFSLKCILTIKAFQESKEKEKEEDKR
jgi:hypothetical protein